MDVLPHLTGVDAVITDPPYGIKRFEKGFGTTRFRGYGVEKNGIQWDKKPPKEMMELLLALGSVHVIWGANNFNLPTSQAFFVWDKFQTVDNFASAELAFCDADGVTAKVFRFPIQRHNRIAHEHPTQKPAELMTWCIIESRIADNATILDPYMGSGTTGIACIRTGRKFIGIEIDKGYFDIACDRIHRELDQFTLPLNDPKNTSCAQEQLVAI